MKRLYKYFIILLSIVFSLPATGLAQSAEKGDLNIAISYFVANNLVPSLSVAVKTKKDGRFQFVGGIGVNLFLDKDSAGTSIGKVVTNDKGVASTIIPASLKKQWGTSVTHTFVATFDGNKEYAATKADLTVGKAKILIDTATGRSIVATVMEMKDNTWEPAKGVDVVMAIRRSGGDLLVNETPTFTTDSTGKVSADFKRDQLPGDAQGNIILVAKIIDNDQYGNLSIEKTVPWGVKSVSVSTFNERALYATRNKAPIWLLITVYAIAITVWGILIMLIFNLFRIRKLGREV